VFILGNAAAEGFRARLPSFAIAHSTMPSGICCRESGGFHVYEAVNAKRALSREKRPFWKPLWQY
jgi:hypothetical protein